MRPSGLMNVFMRTTEETRSSSDRAAGGFAGSWARAEDDRIAAINATAAGLILMGEGSVLEDIEGARGAD